MQPSYNISLSNNNRSVVISKLILEEFKFIRMSMKCEIKQILKKLEQIMIYFYSLELSLNKLTNYFDFEDNTLKENLEYNNQLIEKHVLLIEEKATGRLKNCNFLYADSNISITEENTSKSSKGCCRKQSKRMDSTSTVSLCDNDASILISTLILEEVKCIRLEIKSNFQQILKKLEEILYCVDSYAKSKRLVTENSSTSFNSEEIIVSDVNVLEKVITSNSDHVYKSDKPTQRENTEHGFQLTKKSDTHVEKESTNADKDGSKKCVSFSCSQFFPGEVSKANIEITDITKMKCKVPCKRVQCNICGEYKTNIERHMRTHTGERPHRCSICKKAFIDSFKLQLHKRIHTNERPYICSICDKTFNLSESLRKHMLSHCVNKPHKCLFCDKSFTKKWLLTTHIRKHTGELPYKCSKCYKSYTRQGALTQHMRTHEEFRGITFRCKLCEKLFRSQADLNRHHRTHTGEKPFSCHICSRRFSLKGNLQNHMKTHKKNNNDTVLNIC